MKHVVNGLINGLMVICVILTAMMVCGFTTAEVIEQDVNVGAYYGPLYEADDLIEEWINSIVGEEYSRHSIDSEKYFRGYGVIDAKRFEEDYGFECNPENMESIYNSSEEYDVSYVSIVTAGFIDDYTIYKIEAKTETIPLGTENDIDYFDGEMYFIICYDCEN